MQVYNECIGCAYNPDIHVTDVSIRAGDWVGYPICYCETQSLGGSFTMHDPNLWAQLNYSSTQTQWGWIH